jgi:hypothetical protein
MLAESLFAAALTVTGPLQAIRIVGHKQRHANFPLNNLALNSITEMSVLSNPISGCRRGEHTHKWTHIYLFYLYRLYLAYTCIQPISQETASGLIHIHMPDFQETSFDHPKTAKAKAPLHVTCKRTNFCPVENWFVHFLLLWSS